MFLDIGLSYDPVSRRCDIAFDGRDFVMDRTAMTPLLISIGCSRRARPDDELPSGGIDLYGSAPALGQKRGWCGDALDAAGRFIGSRLWLLQNRKQTEQTRLLAESMAAEATAGIENVKQTPVSIAAQWVAKGILGLRVSAGSSVVNVAQTVG